MIAKFYKKGILALTASNLLFSVASFADTPLRIISAGSNVTEIIYALKATDQLVAVDVTSRYFIESDINKKIQPSQGKKHEIAQLGYHRQLSAEGMMALNPSHLLGSKEMGPETTLELLTASNVDVITLPEGNSLDALIQRIDLIADLTGTQNQAATLKQHAVTEINTLTEQARQFSKKSPTTLFLMLNKDRPATVAGADTPIDRIIELAGGNNSVNKTVASYKPLSYEAVINLAPDYILVSERVWQKYNNVEHFLGDFPLLQATPAGSKGNIIPIPSRGIIGGFGLESIELAKSLQQRYLQDQ